MKLALNIPDREWFELAGRADRANTRLDDLIVSAVRGLLEDSPRRTAMGDRVHDLVLQNVPDPVIAHRLQVPVEHVRVLRRSHGLRPVKFRREEWEQELAA
ncbi:hypothetical protein [uncultured Microbacterium sp.]|uniref:hypothetical protein n=1 Tax=uncultured Microbacterium sp. TaxID=191216 RepID=UPI0028EE12FC|nr:hypothetical protein [uncultured Microbacterium sp.]